MGQTHIDRLLDEIPIHNESDEHEQVNGILQYNPVHPRSHRQKVPSSRLFEYLMHFLWSQGVFRQLWILSSRLGILIMIAKRYTGKNGKVTGNNKLPR